jgi:signal peptidase II
MTGKSRWFWPLFLTVLLTDCSTKQLAEEHLAVTYVPREVLGGVVRFTLAYNPGAAMSISLGDFSRVGFSLLALVALLFLAWLYRHTPASDRWRAAGIALVAGGALGNLIDRVRSPLGVVDFIDVGLGHTRFWIFNLADVGITVGLVVLVVVLQRAPYPWNEPRPRGPRLSGEIQARRAT